MVPGQPLTQRQVVEQQRRFLAPRSPLGLGCFARLYDALLVYALALRALVVDARASKHALSSQSREEARRVRAPIDARDDGRTLLYRRALNARGFSGELYRRIVDVNANGAEVREVVEAGNNS